MEHSKSFRSTGNLWRDIARCSCQIVKYLSCKSCCRSNSSLFKDDDFKITDYSSGESDTEFIAPFIDLDTDEKRKRLTYLWSKAFGRAKGAVLLVEKLRYLRKKILLLGRMPDAAEIKLKQEQAELQTQDAKCIIFPENKYKQRWDIFIAFLLIITALYVPLRVSFIDEFSWYALVVDFLFDFCFALDMVLTFFTAI